MVINATLCSRAVTVVLAGGVGSRLQPLTAHRTKPAVPFGGKYRIIDFTLSNCLHSRLRQIFVLVQYKSHSLQTHLRDGWTVFNPGVGEYITPVPPQMRTGASWYVGTADAVYQNLFLLERSNKEYVVVLSGDHIYRMDYSAMLQQHCEVSADVTVAAMRVNIDEATRFGVLTVNESNRIVEFNEKPAEPKPMPEDPGHALASMGIYIFSLDLMSRVLREDHAQESSSHDFGKDILPHLIETHHVYAYPFGGEAGRVSVDRYWRDVGTIDAYYQANMDLLKPVPAMDLYQPDWRIRTFETQSPPARTVVGESGTKAELVDSVVCSGALVAGANVRSSILSPNVRVEDRAVVEKSILFDQVVVGQRAQLKNCIVDKGVNIPPGETVGFDEVRDRQRFIVSDDGIVVVPKNYEFVTAPQPA